MSTQSIHRTTCAKPTPCATVIIDYAAGTFSPVTGRQWRFHYGPVTLSAATNPDRRTLREFFRFAQDDATYPLTGAGLDKVRSPNSICRVPLLPSLQIGGRLMSRVAASALIHRKETKMDDARRKEIENALNRTFVKENDLSFFRKACEEILKALEVAESQAIQRKRH